MAYFSNSSDGAILDAQCDECLYGKADNIGCPIALAQMLFNYDQNGNDDLEKCLNMLVDKHGTCQMKPLIDKYYNENSHEQVGERPEYKA